MKNTNKLSSAEINQCIMRTTITILDSEIMFKITSERFAENSLSITKYLLRQSITF